MYERKNLPVSFTEYLLRLQSNPWKVSPACLHQHKRVLVRETTPKICFVIYFAEISNYFQMYNSNSNAESKIRKKKIINNKSLKKNYIIRCIVKVLDIFENINLKLLCITSHYFQFQQTIIVIWFCHFKKLSCFSYRPTSQNNKNS